MSVAWRPVGGVGERRAQDRRGSTMREDGSLMKDDDARRLEVLSTEGRLFGKRECALLPHWSPTTRRRHAQETSRDPHPACRRPFVTHGSMTHHRVLVVKTQEQKGRTKLSRQRTSCVTMLSRRHMPTSTSS